MRERQFLIHERVDQLQAQEEEAKKPHDKHFYGSAPGLSKPTYGRCEKLGADVPFPDPVTGPYKMREGFAETQKMRAASKWWGRDEQHFMKKEGFKAPEATINEVHCL